ncbi:MAG TPA: hypothetical protein VGP42_06305 [Stellaceae bacterium]|jgi:hypothetical protein|nr:hypothetical protein [Stellaceae bacterium]
MTRTSLKMPRIANKRQSYAVRSGMVTRAASIVAKAVVEAPVFVTDEDGHRMRQWKAEELQRYTTEDIKSALRLRRAVEKEEMLEFVPPSAIKYCQTKGWIVQAEGAPYFFVTRKAATELDLPRKHQGRAIQFLDRGL